MADTPTFLSRKAGPARLTLERNKTNSQKETKRGTLSKANLSLAGLERCLHELKDGLLITNGDGIGLWVNRAMTQVVGLTPDYFLCKPVSSLYEAGFFVHEAVTERARRSGNELTDNQIINTGNTVLVTSVPVMDQKDGSIRHMVTTVRSLAQLRPSSVTKRTGKAHLKDQPKPTDVLRDLGIVYRSPAMKRAVEVAAAIASTDVTVLISGATGVGKELMARLIHDLSPRRCKPFLQINCAALPKDLAESELFGYEPGAFTGAGAGGKAGFFEAANGGTILLDEIGEMPLEMQTKLLRVLQEGEVFRLGATRATPLDVRVLAATNADLPALIREKKFRADLYYRLNVVPIEIPPLSTRPEDVSFLLGHYLHLYCEKYHVSRRFAPKTFELLMRHDWPGNVRELANLVHRLVLINSRLEITPDLLPQDIVGGQGQGLSLMNLLERLDHHSYCESLPEALEVLERNVIEVTLRSVSSIREASRKLGIPHPTLINKMRKYSLDVREDCELFRTGLTGQEGDPLLFSAEDRHC